MTTTALSRAGHERGTPAYRRLGAAMWCAGLATFVLVYCVQALLPTLAAEFDVSSSVASLALSATTGTLALAIVPLSAVAESWGRARVMTAALAASAVLGVLAPLAPTFATLVAVRALQGVALAALPALAMAHVTRELAPPPPRVRLRELGVPLRAQLSDPGLCCLFGIAFLLMGGFVTVYNYLGFRLLAAPFELPAALVGLVFLGYLAGTWASTGAGRLGARFGRRRVLWAAVLLAVAGAWT